MNISNDTYEQFRQGSLEAFYAETWASLMAYASRVLGDYHAMMAEDCVQETIVTVYNSRNTLTSPLHMKSFVFTCLHNRCVSLLRKSGNREQYIQKLPQDVEREKLAMMIEQETYDMLYAAVAELPEKYRRIFELNFEQGLRNTEAAEALGISLSLFNKRKRAMIAILREKFKDNDTMKMLIAALLVT